MLLILSLDRNPEVSLCSWAFISPFSIIKYLYNVGLLSSIRDRCGIQVLKFPSSFSMALGFSFCKNMLLNKTWFCHCILNTDMATYLTILDSRTTVLCPLLCDPLRKDNKHVQKAHHSFLIDCRVFLSNKIRTSVMSQYGVSLNQEYNRT